MPLKAGGTEVKESKVMGPLMLALAAAQAASVEPAVRLLPSSVVTAQEAGPHTAWAALTLALPPSKV
jgi:hypothetical protein